MRFGMRVVSASILLGMGWAVTEREAQRKQKQTQCKQQQKHWVIIFVARDDSSAEDSQDSHGEMEFPDVRTSEHIRKSTFCVA